MKRFKAVSLAVICVFLSGVSGAVNYLPICGHVHSALKHCYKGRCVGSMAITNVCQYTFLKILIPAGTRSLKVSFRNKNFYYRPSCRGVSAMVRLDNEYLDEPKVRRRTISYDDLIGENSAYPTCLLSDRAKAFLTIYEAFDSQHYLYVGTLTHVDEIDITLVMSEVSSVTCHGDADISLNMGCPGDEECGSSSPVAENPYYSSPVAIRELFHGMSRYYCKPGNISGCSSPEDCEDAGGYWINGECKEQITIDSVSFQECGYLCCTTDKDVYILGDSISFSADIPRFNTQVDVYLGVVSPNGVLYIPVEQEDGVYHLNQVVEVSQIEPVEVDINGPASILLNVPTAVELFNGDQMPLVEPGRYELYLVVVPSGEDVLSVGPKQITMSEFEVLE